MPARAPCPVPTITAVGVARPSAQGQAITSTATPLTSAGASSPPSHHHSPKVASAIATTVGTKTAAMRSARRCTAGLPPWACSTRRTMPASRVSAPTPLARQCSTPSPLTVAAKTLSPGTFGTGTLSPVSIASSADEVPASTSPSTGTASPGRSTKVMPATTWATGSSTSWPSRSIQAVGGCRRSSASMATEVRARARASSSLPSSTRVMMLAEASKYTCRSWRPASTTNRLKK